MAANEAKHNKQDVETRKEPHRALRPFDEMDSMFEGFFPSGLWRPFRWERPAWSDMLAPFEGKLPRVDVVDRDDDILVRAEVPGVKREGLDVSMTDNNVTIKGTTAEEKEEEKGEYYRHETARGSFTRTVALPGEVDGSKARATFTDGVLEITMPKVAKARRHTVRVE